MAEENTPQPTEAKPPKAALGEKAAKAKAPKASAVEDKPFAEFIQQDYLPALGKAFASQQVQDVDLKFDGQNVSGTWLGGKRLFSVYFPKQDIQGQRAFSCSIEGGQPSTIEPFLIDERKITLDLLVFGVIQRLNAQKWFGGN
jgi:hypothetical protein